MGPRLHGLYVRLGVIGFVRSLAMTTLSNRDESWRETCEDLTCTLLVSGQCLEPVLATRGRNAAIAHGGVD